MCLRYPSHHNTFSIHVMLYFSSLSTNRIRQRLFDLMGTDVIRLNDTRYFKKLSTKLREEYEVHQVATAQQPLFSHV